jgi:hypothetical protein
MDGPLRELGYGVTVVLGTALALTATTLGLFTTPLVATGVASGLVVGSTFALVPREAWFSAGAVGVSAVVLAGTLVPRSIADVEFVTPGSVMSVTLGASLVIVVAAITTLHYVTFRPRAV